MAETFTAEQIAAFVANLSRLAEDQEDFAETERRDGVEAYAVEKDRLAEMWRRMASAAPAILAGHVFAGNDNGDDRLLLLRTKFRAEQIGKLPKITCWACTQANRDRRGNTCDDHKRTKCHTCDNYVTTAHTHVDYVGHPEVTDRLLDADLRWNWRPMAFDADGLPQFDRWGGLWMYITVDGVERIGYGDAIGKTAGPAAVKEAIGDGLRNGAMRFGVALDQWAKSDLHADENQAEQSGEQPAEDVPASSEEINGVIIALEQVRNVRDRAGVSRALAAALGRPIGSARELTSSEAQTFIEELYAEAGARPPGGAAQVTSMLGRGQSAAPAAEAVS